MLRWLEDIGLPQYKEIFSENTIDGAVLLSLTAADMVEVCEFDPADLSIR